MYIGPLYMGPLSHTKIGVVYGVPLSHNLTLGAWDYVYGAAGIMYMGPPFPYGKNGW